MTLAEPSVAALRAALRVVAPALADASIVPRGLEPSDDPQWCAASAVVDGRYVVKFAWSEEAAERVFHQARVLEALRTAAPRLPLPEVVAAIVDLETVGAGEPEFDLRCLPGDCGPELFLEVVARYDHLTATRLDVHRIMAWHARTIHDDIRWRTEAGVPLPDQRTPAAWLDDLNARFAALGIER